MKTYNAKHVIITARGVPATGLGEDGFITIKPKTPTFSSTIGADGLVVRNQSTDGRVDIEITLLAASPFNGTLSYFFDLDKASGIAPFPVSVEDLGGRMVCTVPTAWVVQPPDLTAAKAEGMVTWVLEGESATTSFDGAKF
jgi:hypothetical protein